jgi:O-antigen/teichoic acid export membrane protein
MNMPGRMRDLARHTGAYGVATVAGGITRAALVPIIARFLGTEEYGRASVVLILIMLLTIVFDLGQSSSLIKFVNEAPDDEEKRKVISTVLAASLLFSLSFVVVLLAVSGRLSGLLLGSEAYGGLVLMGVAGGFGNALLQIGLSYERAVARSFRYVTTKVIDFGLPLVPMNLAMWVLAYSDIYLLRRLLRPEVALSEVGLYQYAHEICLVLVLPVTSLNLAWPQFLFSNHSKDGAPEVFARVHRYFSFFVIGMAFVLSMFSYHVIGFVGSRPYMGCSGVVPLLAGSLVFYGLSILYASGLYVAGKTRILAAVVICCSALNVLLNLLLIPALGKEGAASATLVTNLIMAASLLALSGRHYRIPFSLAPAVLSVCVGAAAVAGHRLVADDALGGGNPGLAALGTAVFSAATLALYRMGPGEIRKGAILLRSTLKRGGP